MARHGERLYHKSFQAWNLPRGIRSADSTGGWNRWVESGLSRWVESCVESGMESVVAIGGWSRGWSRGWNQGWNLGFSPNREFRVLRFDLRSGFLKHGQIVILFLVINKIARPQPQHEHVATGSR